MIKKSYLTIFFIGFIFLLSSNADNKESYINNDWGFQIDIPKEWNVREAKEIIESMESRQNISPEVLIAIKNSGLIVNISQYPFTAIVDLNPNINISGKNIEIEPRLRSDVEMLSFAKKILSSIFGDKEYNSKEININNFIGLNSSYKYLTKDNIEIRNEIAILIDRDKNNYFMITFAYKDKEYVDIFKKCVESFKKL